MSNQLPQIGFKRISEAYSVLRDPEKRAECAERLLGALRGLDLQIGVTIPN